MADHGLHVSMESSYFSYCQEAPGRHIQCLLKVSEELVPDVGQILCSQVCARPSGSCRRSDSSDYP